MDLIRIVIFIFLMSLVSVISDENPLPHPYPIYEEVEILARCT